MYNKKVGIISLLLVISLCLSFASGCSVELPMNSESSTPYSEQSSEPSTQTDDASAQWYDQSSDDKSEISEQEDVSIDLPPVDSEGLVISELMTDNKTYFTEGFYDWVELYNKGDEEINLSDYYLSDNAEEPKLSRLSDKTLRSGEYVVLHCDEKELNFSLSKNGGLLFLSTEDGKLADSFSYGACEPDYSLIPDAGVCKYPTPCRQNDYNGYLSYRASLPNGLVINEAMASNTKYYEINGNYYDLIELKNLTSATIDLSDYYLSDSNKELKAWRLPEKNLAAGGIYVVVASGNGGSQTDFKISSSGEGIYLTDLSGNCVDSMYVRDLPTDSSLGRSDYELVYSHTPTIGSENTHGLTELLAPPTSSVKSGIYNNAQSITLSADEGNIIYTVDGSSPKDNGIEYDGKSINVTKTTAVRCYAVKDGYIPSDEMTYNYFINIDEYTLPILKISADDNDIFGETEGIYVNYLKKWERKINLALYVSGKEEFNINCGLKIFGQGSRELEKKSFQLKFRGEYGASSLKYDIFENEKITEFESLVLRSGSEDADRAFFRDEFMTSLVGMSGNMPEVYVQQYRPVNLYINDRYFGIYYIRERVDEDYVASHFQVDADSVSMVKAWYELECGSIREWDNLLDFCRDNSLTNSGNYKKVIDQISVNGFIDYYIARAYMGDVDFCNIRFFKSSEGDGKWRIIFFDLDWGFVRSDKPLTKIVGSYSDKNSLNNVIIYKLLQNTEFRTLFLQRLDYHLKNTFSAENVIARIDAMEAEIEHDMQYDRERWDLSMSSWHKQVQALRNYVESENTTRVKQMQADADSLFG